MKQKLSAVQLAVVIAIIHCIAGNLVGISGPSSGFLLWMFLPYSLIAGLSSLVGWDVFSLLLELLSFGFMTFIFLLIVRLLRR